MGGNLNDKDKNIYTYSIKDGNLVRGESIGTTTSMTSFYNGDKDNGKGKGGCASGSIINLNDKSGDNFLENMFRNTPLMFDGYMANARNGGKYDFKVTNGEDKPISGIDIYRYACREKCKWSNYLYFCKGRLKYGGRFCCWGKWNGMGRVSYSL